jgi:hypothetical protein
MSRKTTELTALQTRKQLLLVESELNRLQLTAEWQTLKAGLDQKARQVAAVSSMIESAAKIGTSFTGFFDDLGGDDKKSGDKKSSWISRMVGGVRSGFSLWSALRSR